MVDSTEQDVTDRVPPEDVFSILGNETRIDIIQALWQAENDHVSFSELRNRAAVADSGRFNYHLGKLIGTFVQREECRYGLTYAGRRIVGAILDGTYTKRAEIDPFEIGSLCSACGSSLEASYESDQFVVRCPNCAETVLRFAFPPGVLDGRPREEFAETASRWIRAQLSFTVNGVCPNCAGVITHSITRESEQHSRAAGLEYDCKRCQHHATTTVGMHLSYHPAVIALYDEHGIDLNEAFLQSYVDNADQCTSVRSENPWRISVSVSLADDELELVVDEELNVVERHRE
ncbi:winged helix-turn-helix domain-containing protein [Halocatena pleomorpha]|uniref:ArsR family transcriptional regulator n=1 Tax=Halocatena pleomorpha TaxID=1785090 RepID=A0A3P3R5E4_9EURY|nr:helix-turn-helix domain-containing protein [Halocatena pleomorpha]RRJ28575.1 ArsR family transcriptional regulator [Halocatena pleomorpha]